MGTVALADSVVATAHLQRGIASLMRNRFADAVADFDAALSYAPDDLYAHWNRATALLSLGDYRNGFAAHDRGWRLWRGDRVKALPRWDGTAGRRVLLHHDLGFGDAIMCLRFLPALRERGKITLVVDPPLARLACCDGIEVVTEVPQSLHAFDCQLPLFSAMSLLVQMVETIPRAAYIAANWQRGGCRIGIAWSGNTQKMFSPARFITLLGDLASASLQALQPGPVPPGVTPLQAEDFADTARVIERMDHVVTVDTAVAHLAGAMGHPSTHLVLPFVCDWRWWQVAAWYPALQTYRQREPGDAWSEPFARLCAVVGMARL